MRSSGAAEVKRARIVSSRGAPRAFGDLARHGDLELLEQATARPETAVQPRREVGVLEQRAPNSGTAANAACSKRIEPDAARVVRCDEPRLHRPRVRVVEQRRDDLRQWVEAKRAERGVDGDGGAPDAVCDGKLTQLGGIERSVGLRGLFRSELCGIRRLRISSVDSTSAPASASAVMGAAGAEDLPRPPGASMSSRSTPLNRSSGRGCDRDRL